MLWAKGWLPEHEMDSGILKGKFVGTLIGTGIGDALGAPFEGSGPNALGRQSSDTIDYLPISGYLKGQYTDDTQLTIAIARAIVKDRCIRGNTVAEEIATFWRTGKIIGEGIACGEAMRRYISGAADWESCGTGDGRAGNGSAMRAGPVGLWDFDDPDRIPSDSRTATIMTHTDERAIAGTAAVARAVAYLVAADSFDPIDMVETVASCVETIHAGFAALLRKLPEWLDAPYETAHREIRDAAQPGGAGGAWSGGITPFVIPTVLAALYCFLKSPAGPVESIVRAINMGGDTDTVAAITGAVAGSHNGAAAFPERLVNGLKDADFIAQLGEHLYSTKTSADA